MWKSIAAVTATLLLVAGLSGTSFAGSGGHPPAQDCTDGCGGTGNGGAVPLPDIMKPAPGK